MEAIWDDKSPFSVLPKLNGSSRTADHRIASSSTYSPFSSDDSPSVTARDPISHGINHTGIRTVEEIEAEMRAIAIAQQSRAAAQRHQQELLFLQQQQEQEQLIQQQQEQELLRRRLQLQQEQQQQLQLQRLQQQQLQQHRDQVQHQRTPPPRMLPTSQSPRFHEHQRQILLLQQQQEQQQQLRVLELQEQLRMEGLERQMHAQQIRHSPNHFNHQRHPSAELNALAMQQLQQQRRQRSQSPAYVDPHYNGSLQQGMPFMPQNIQAQQRLLSELAQADFVRELQGTNQAEQETLRIEAMRKIVEAEKMEEKRRRKAAKIAHMVCNRILFYLMFRCSHYCSHQRPAITT